MGEENESRLPSIKPSTTVDSTLVCKETIDAWEKVYYSCTCVHVSLSAICMLSGMQEAFSRVQLSSVLCDGAQILQQARHTCDYMYRVEFGGGVGGGGNKLLAKKCFFFFGGSQ